MFLEHLRKKKDKTKEEENEEKLSEIVVGKASEENFNNVRKWAQKLKKITSRISPWYLN